ncbi:MAG: hypothetical protein RR904_05460 [Bacilli bacterium]
MNVIVENGNIYSIDIYGSKECIGATKEAYLEMKDMCEKATKKAEEYFEELVKAGIKERELTNEEINRILLDKINNLEKEMKELKIAKEPIILEEEEVISNDKCEPIAKPSKVNGYSNSKNK